jgi:hypothetical protein
VDVFTRAVGGAISGAIENVFLAAGTLVRGAFGELTSVVPLPVAVLLGLTLVLAVGWRFAR